MTNNSQTSGEIEREIEQERAGLSSTLDELQDRFSVETVARQLGDQFRLHGSDIGQAVSDSVKRNPMALALTGVGIAWMMFGDRTPSSSYSDRRSSRLSGDSTGGYGQYGRSRYAVRGQRDTGTHQSREAGRSYYAGEYGSLREAPSWAGGRDEDAWNGAPDDHDNGPGFGDRSRHAAESVGDAAKSTGGAIRDRASSASRAASDATRSAVSDVKSSAASASDRAARLRDRLSEGTETMTEEARERVIEARRRALEARDAAWDYTRRGRETAVDIFEEHPLIAGALAVAVGAAVGAAIPRSGVEDEYMGEQSDELFDEAERIYAEERERVSAVAQAAVSEAKDIVDESRTEADAKAPDMTDKAIDRAGESVRRVSDAAKTEAQKQNLVDSES